MRSVNFILILSFALMSSGLMADKKAAQLTTITFDVKGMTCPPCKIGLQNALNAIPKLSETAKCNIVKATCSMQYIGGKKTLDLIHAAFKNQGKEAKIKISANKKD